MKNLAHACMITALTILFVACTPNMDIPPGYLQKPGTDIWGVSPTYLGNGYEIKSMTILNSPSRSNKFLTIQGHVHTSPIAQASYKGWRWVIAAQEAVYDSWKIWNTDKKVEQLSRAENSLDHPVANWSQAMTRSYDLVQYLTGATPIPLDLDAYLVPDNATVHLTVIRHSQEAIPFTFAFPYPASTKTDMQSERFRAFTHAVGMMLYEYQHVLFGKELALQYHDRVVKIVNNEARSTCWEISAATVLAAGTSSEITLTGSAQSAGPQMVEEWGSQPTYQSAVPWARAWVLAYLARYVQKQGLPTTFSLKDHRARNAVLSFCRALTQNRWDITSGSIPIDQIQLVNFDLSSD